MATRAIDNITDADLLTAEEVARILRMSRAQAYLLIQQDKIPVVRVSEKCVRVLASDLVAYVNKNRSGGIRIPR